MSLNLAELMERNEKQQFLNDTPQINVCADCEIPLLIANECTCPNCGRCYSYQTTDGTDPLSGTVKLSTRGGRSKRVGVNSNYSEAQTRSIKTLLMERKRIGDEKKIVIPMDVLNEAVNKYNEMQQIMDGGKKFVKRANIKNQILASLIKIICDQKGLSRKEQDIARFMGLESDGFSQGDSIVRECVDCGSLNLEITEDPLRDARAFAERYLESLGCDAEFIKTKSEFIKDCVELSIINRIAFKSKITSKVAGLIYMLNEKLKLKKTVKELEEAVDGTKKSTYIAFVESILKNKLIFEQTFIKYDIPYN